MKDMDFVRRVLAAFDGFNGADPDDLFWRVDSQYAPVTFFARCNDLFDWGTADLQEITPENIEEMERATTECRALDPVHGVLVATTLFCCRVVGSRPQGACYDSIDPKFWPLLDNCGPEREVDMMNPKAHPNQRGVVVKDPRPA